MRASARFNNDWTQTLTGDLAQGGELAVDYDLSRLQELRSRFRGAAMWDIVALVQFQRDGQVLAASLTAPARTAPGGVTMDRLPVVATFPVPGDAVQVEMWFLNLGYIHFSDPPEAWDSHFGQNYRFDVRNTSPSHPVALRTNVQTARDVVNALQLSVEKQRHQFGEGGSSQSDGSELRTRVKLDIWVKNISYTKSVWFDAHVFDGGNLLVHAQTRPLQYKEGASGGGDLFEFDDVIYFGSRGQPGSVSPLPDARRLQLRLYCEISGQVFSDGILHDFQLPEDGAVH